MKKTNLQKEQNDKSFTEKSPNIHSTVLNYQQNTTTRGMITMKTTNMSTRQDKSTEKKERVIAMKNEINRTIKKEKKEERVTAMKRTSIIILIIGILIGAALCAVILKDGGITIWEAAAGFAYLAALRVGTMLAGRRSKEAAGEKTPSQPSAAKTRRFPAQAAPAAKTAA